jgi:hypothetical protein
MVSRKGENERDLVNIEDIEEVESDADNEKNPG